MSDAHSSREADEGDINNTDARQVWLEGLSPETRDLLVEDERWFMHQSLSTPCLNAVRAVYGVYLEDVAGNRLLDFHGNNVHQLGYGHPAVIEAVTNQLQQLSFAPRRYTNVPAVQLAARLAHLTPGDDDWKVLFAPGAAEAVSMALKLVRLATGRYKTVSMWGSFHGATRCYCCWWGGAVS
jgi:4-aminobutyrate aminotransferase